MVINGILSEMIELSTGFVMRMKGETSSAGSPRAVGNRKSVPRAKHNHPKTYLMDFAYIIPSP
jgi:hypothetical protein